MFLAVLSNRGRALRKLSDKDPREVQEQLFIAVYSDIFPHDLRAQKPLDQTFSCVSCV